MKTAIKTLLSAFGLAPASYVERLNTDVQRAEAKIAHLEEQIAQLRTDGQSWKQRHDDTAEGMAGWKQAARRAEAEAERAARPSWHDLGTADVADAVLAHERAHRRELVEGEGLAARGTRDCQSEGQTRPLR